MELTTLLLEIENRIAIVRLNRPDKLNALNIQLLNELKRLFHHLLENDEVCAVIITGIGEKAFAAGADIAELKALDSIKGKIFSENGQDVFNLIENFPKPVIAAVNGFALGGGFELALACHIRTCSETAKFGLPELTLGIIPGYGGTQRLSRLINKSRAMELILSSEMVNSEEAYKLGIVNKVFPLSDLLDKSKEMAAKFTQKPITAVSFAIKSINASDETTLKEGLSIEAGLFGLLCSTSDFQEGTSAFLEKRKPEFNK